MQVFSNKFYINLADGKYRIFLNEAAMVYFKVSKFTHTIMPYFYILH